MLEFLNSTQCRNLLVLMIVAFFATVYVRVWLRDRRTKREEQERDEEGRGTVEPDDPKREERP